jgi:glycosyltransferase involved in cell wall biosynthesis
MIMHVITNFTASAGAETMLSRLLCAIDDDALVVSLIDISDRNKQLAGEGVRFKRLGIRSLGKAVTGILDLSRLIARERPSVIVCWMYHAVIAGTVAARLSRTNAPVFWNIRQSLDDPAALSRSTRTALRISRRLSRLSAGIIYNSARSLDQHRRYGFCHRKAEVIPNGFDTVTEFPLTGRTSSVIGIAARLHPQKDHQTFFRAAALLHRHRPHARFVAVGAGLCQDNPAVGEMIVASGLPSTSIDLRGEVDDMDAFYRSIDVLVSSSRTEGFPNVVAEAMSYGKPVVTTDVGDAAAIVGETGIVVPPGDAEALADGMNRMLDLTASAYSALAGAARRRIADYYPLSEVARRYEMFLGEAGSRSPGGPASGVRR